MAFEGRSGKYDLFCFDFVYDKRCFKTLNRKTCGHYGYPAGALKTSCWTCKWKRSWCKFSLTPPLCKGTGPAMKETKKELNQIILSHNIFVAANTCRTFPRVLPGWMVALDTTLGAKQGTLYRAPRNAERKQTDDNVWAKCDFWNNLVCAPSVPLCTSALVQVLYATFT